LLFLADALTNKELRSAIGKLDYRGRIDFPRRRQDRIDRVRANAIHRRERKFVRLGIVKKLLHLITEENSGSKSFLVAHD
jgi:hypothetical protein